MTRSVLDGSYLIFTRWDLTRGWQESCDLYIAFRRGENWSEPVALTRINTERPDYAAALSSDGQWLYYRAGGRYVRRSVAEALPGLP